jgi:anti-sigma factor RsiW
MDPTLHNDQLNQAPPAIEEQFYWLMSLALDGMLDDEDRVTFDAYQAQYPALADMWQEWQVLDRQLDVLPHVEPAPGFVQRFEVRLAGYEAQQQQRVLALSFVSAVVAGVFALSAVIGAGAWLLSTQGPWLGGQIGNAVYLTIVIQNWVNAIVDTLIGLAATPQAQALGMVYVAVAVAMIAGWVRLLQRSARYAPALSAPGLE